MTRMGSSDHVISIPRSYSDLRCGIGRNALREKKRMTKVAAPMNSEESIRWLLSFSRLTPEAIAQGRTRGPTKSALRSSALPSGGTRRRKGRGRIGEPKGIREDWMRLSQSFEIFWTVWLIKFSSDTGIAKGIGFRRQKAAL